MTLIINGLCAREGLAAYGWAFLRLALDWDGWPRFDSGWAAPSPARLFLDVASRGETSPAPTGRHMNSRRIARGALGSLRGDHDVGLREITALEEKRLPGSLGQRV